MLQFEQQPKGSALKNSKVKAATIDPGTTQVTSTSEHQDEKSVSKKSAINQKKYTMISDALAESDLCVRNWKIPKASEWFPNEWRMQFADLYYPSAKGGPLFIDTPAMPHDVARCERKLEVLQKHGIRYTFIKTGDDVDVARARLGGDGSDEAKARTERRDLHEKYARRERGGEKPESEAEA